jgi:aminoglycoside phosphotransferase (APT) family kinase protein
MNTQIQNQKQLERTLPEENRFPLSSLLNTSSIKSILEKLCHNKHKQINNIEISFVRYNPGVSCIVCYSATIKDDQSGTTDEAVLYADSFVQEHFRKVADRLDNQSWIPGTILASPQPVDSLHAIFYQFPNDGGIPGLKLLAEPEKLLHLIVSAVDSAQKPQKAAKLNSFMLHRLRYKPGNRFIARCEFNYLDGTPAMKKRKTILLRFEQDKNSEKGFELSLKLYEALKGNSRLNLPRPLFFMPEYNLQAFEWVEAEKLSELLRGSDPELWVKRAAHVLSALHACEVPGLLQHEATFFKDRIQHTADFLAHANEDIKNLSEEIAGRLDSITMDEADCATGLVHGDFHQGQLLVADGRDYVLDFSRSYWGDSTADVGNFLAQLRYWHIIGRIKNINALELLFVDAYERPRNVKVSHLRLKYWKTIGLFELAMREFRRMKPDWPIMCEKLLLECQKTLDA